MTEKDAPNQPVEEESQRGKTNKWIWLACGAGFTFALGNVALGINLSQLGLMGAMFPGPFTVIMLSIYRIYEACKIKGKTGSFIDKPTSNYWTEVPNEEPERLY